MGTSTGIYLTLIKPDLGEISFLNALPIWAAANGSLPWLKSKSLLKLTNIPWAVSGRKYLEMKSKPLNFRGMWFHANMRSAYQFWKSKVLPRHNGWEKMRRVKENGWTPVYFALIQMVKTDTALNYESSNTATCNIQLVFSSSPWTISVWTISFKYSTTEQDRDADFFGYKVFIKSYRASTV